MVEEMQIYKVGGCIRDKLLGLPVNDNDFVVVGSTPEEMTKMGFKPVGSDFPVFLHPNTHEEYALARSEKKVSQGYRGFTFQASPDISLAEDLKRRDLTINAIAEDEDGQLIDLFDGLTDLKNKVIRHVSNSFVEDPLRVLRAARFSAKLNFEVAEDTMDLMKKIVESGELKTLSEERVWAEVHKALMTKYSSNFFNILYKIGAFKQILPEFGLLVENTTNFALYKSISQKMFTTNQPIEKRFAILYYFVSEEYTKFETKEFIDAAMVSNRCKTLANLVVTYYNPMRMIDQLSRDDIYSLVANLDPSRRNERYADFIDLVYTIAVSHEDLKARHHLELLKKIVDRFSRIKYEQIKQDYPDAFVSHIHKHKMRIIDEIITEFPEY